MPESLGGWEFVATKFVRGENRLNLSLDRELIKVRMTWADAPPQWHKAGLMIQLAPQQGGGVARVYSRPCYINEEAILEFMALTSYDLKFVPQSWVRLIKFQVDVWKWAE